MTLYLFAELLGHYPENHCCHGAVLALSRRQIGRAKCVLSRVPPDAEAHAMNRTRMQVFYSGRVQGVGFRYTAKSVAMGFDVTGTIRNLPDGRVELQAEGSREELDAFRQGIRDSGLEGFIRDESVSWHPATGAFRGFEIVR